MRRQWVVQQELLTRLFFGDASCTDWVEWCEWWTWNRLESTRTLASIQSRVQCFNTAKWFHDKEGITVKYNARERLQTAPAGYTKKSNMDSRRKHNAQLPWWRLFLLYCYYCSTVLKSEWQWPEPFQTTERRSIFVMRKWKWWRRRSLTLTVSCAMKEQWSAPGNYGVGKQWHHRHKTEPRNKQQMH